MLNNPVYVDLFLKKIWHEEPVDVRQYLADYATRRAIGLRPPTLLITGWHRAGAALGQ